jgi:hypothetical protein
MKRRYDHTDNELTPKKPKNSQFNKVAEIETESAENNPTITKDFNSEELDDIYEPPDRNTILKAWGNLITKQSGQNRYKKLKSITTKGELKKTLLNDGEDERNIKHYLSFHNYKTKPLIWHMLTYGNKNLIEDSLITYMISNMNDESINYNVGGKTIFSHFIINWARSTVSFKKFINILSVLISRLTSESIKDDYHWQRQINIEKIPHFKEIIIKTVKKLKNFEISVNPKNIDEHDKPLINFSLPFTEVSLYADLPTDKEIESVLKKS